MGYRRVVTTYDLKFEEYDGLVIRMKSIRIGEMRRLVKEIEDESKSSAELMDSLIDAIERGLVSWNLEEEDGTEVPADRSGIEDLEFEMANKIVDAWLGGMTGPDDDLGKGSASGGTSPVPLPTMEAL